MVSELWTCSNLDNQGNHDNHEIDGNVTDYGNLGNSDSLTIGAVETLLSLVRKDNHDNSDQSSHKRTQVFM
jgi:hypothetical protein